MCNIASFPVSKEDSISQLVIIGGIKQVYYHIGFILGTDVFLHSGCYHKNTSAIRMRKKNIKKFRI